MGPKGYPKIVYVLGKKYYCDDDGYRLDEYSQPLADLNQCVCDKCGRGCCREKGPCGKVRIGLLDVVLHPGTSLKLLLMIHIGIIALPIAGLITNSATVETISTVRSRWAGVWTLCVLIYLLCWIIVTLRQLVLQYTKWKVDISRLPAVSREVASGWTCICQVRRIRGRKTSRAGDCGVLYGCQKGRSWLVLVFLLAEMTLLLVPLVQCGPVIAAVQGAMKDKFGSPDEDFEKPWARPFSFGSYMLLGVDYVGPFGDTAKWGNYRNIGYKQLDGEVSYPIGNWPPGFDTKGVRKQSDTLYLETWLPKSQSKAHTVVYFHGGDYRKQKSPNCATGYWLSKGVSVVTPQYRMLSHGFKLEDMVEDLTDAVEFMMAHNQTWGTRFLFVGEGTGAHLATLVGYRMTQLEAQSRIVGIVNLYGFLDFRYIADNRPKLYKRWRGSFEYLLEDFNRDSDWSNSSSLTYITKNAPPTVTVHGSTDYYAPVEMAEALHNTLAKYKVRNLLVKLPMQNHYLDRGWFSLGGQVSRFVIEQMVRIRIF